MAGSSMPTRRPGGFLDPLQQIESIYETLISQNKKVKEQVRKTFQAARILVVGRSGCGKSTLIRLLVGDTGPRSMSRGRAGKQSILNEWRHPDPELPLIIHDSNGIGTDGEHRIAELKTFLDQRLTTSLSGAEFVERVHVVWYVFSAMDGRVSDDGGLLELLTGYGKDLPLLLIMTNNDYVKRIGENNVKVNPAVLDLLLEKINDRQMRERLKDSMVRVGNKIQVNKLTGQVIAEKSVSDMDGMRLLFTRTKELIDKNLWILWTACQGVDMNAKLVASSELIVNTRRDHLLSGSVVAALPLAQQLELAAMYGNVTHGLAKIWNVSENLEKAIITKFLREERWHAVSRNLARNIIGALALGGAIAATVLTAGLAAPSLVLAPAGAAWSHLESTSTLVMSYALVVLGSIIYVRTHEMTTTSSDAPSSVQDYLNLCEEFVNSEWATRLSAFSDKYSSLWEIAFRETRQSKRLLSEIVKFFREITLCRPTSLFSHLDMSLDSMTFESGTLVSHMVDVGAQEEKDVDTVK